MLDLKKQLRELAKQVYEEIIRRMHSEVGINPRTGTNTLVGSNLEKSVEVKPSEDGIVFTIADYYEYVVHGFKRTGRFPNTYHLLIENLTSWVRRKHIVVKGLTQNQFVYWLAHRMVFEGREIAPRPFINYDDKDISIVLPFLEEFFEKWADNIFLQITEELDKHLTND